MERDFMGLTVKQEIPEEPTDPASFRSSAMQQTSSNKMSNVPQYLSFKGAHEEKPKTGFDALASTGLVTITTTGAPHNHYTNRFDRNSVFRSHGLVQYPVSAAPAGCAAVGSTELRNVPQTTRGPAQLTIFYAGSVCVYDNISPEKAQAIMLLAGNGAPASSATPSIGGFAINSSHIAAPCFPSPVLKATQSAVGSISANESTVVKTIGVMTPSNKLEPLKANGSIRATLVPSAVPQARKASLARFLEKRKERVMSASPYACKQSADCSNSLGSSSLPATT